MKVLICAYDRPGLIATGPNAWIQRLIPDLREVYHVEVDTLFFYSGDMLSCPTLQFFITHNLPVHTFSIEDNPYVENQVKEILALTKRNNYSILIANLVIPAFYAARYLKKYNIHSIGVLHSNDSFYNSVIQKFIAGKARESIDSFVCVSNYLLAKASKNNHNNVSLISIPCGTPIGKVRAKRQGDKLMVVYAGRLEIEQKQVVKLTKSFIKAAEQNPNLEFCIYGSGSQKNVTIELIENSNFSQEQINYCGEVHPSEIIMKISQHHVFTLMSDYEGMPVALMEAMSCGLVPVCLEEKSGINEIIQDGINGFIVKDRGSDYQEKLSILQKNPELWEKMSKQAQKTIREKYSSEITNKQWADLLDGMNPAKVLRIRMPVFFRIKGEVLPYGDIRKPSYRLLMKQRVQKTWFALRLKIRPRSRLRVLLNRKNGSD